MAVETERDRIERVIRECFEPDPREALAVYLFGSRARGTARKDSDVDVAVLFERDPAPRFDELPLSIESELESRIGLTVQVVPLNRAPADLVHRVLRDGRLLVDRDPSRRIRFEVKLRNEFFDLQPLLRAYRHPAPDRP